MNIYGLIGNPLSHSFSKQYFDDKFKKEQIVDAIFNLYALPIIDEVALLLKTQNIKGLAVTIPYKQTVFTYLNEVNNAAKSIGAVNCIKIKDGVAIGYNTDVVGFEQSLLPLLKPHHTKALVLGSGGSSKAVQYVLQKLGINFLVVSRNKIDNNLSIAYDNITQQIIETHTLIINCTPLGMYPNVDTFPNLPYHFLTPNHLLYDLTYKPEKTTFLQNGESQYAAIKNGFEMLILQAEENWKIWNDIKP